jgi:hypothetical protein
MNDHTRDRLALRVPPSMRGTFASRIDTTVKALTQQGVTDAAVRIWREASKVSTTDGSNGDTAVLIVRHGDAATIMWRRSSQPHTRQAYKVARVLCLKGTCNTVEHRGHA